LVFSHVAKAERGGRDLPLGEFVRQFAGLTSTAKAKAVTKKLPDFHHLSDFRGNERAVATLLGAMQANSKVPKAASLGSVGKEHFEAFFRQVYTVREFTYKKAEGILASGLPITFELALATLEYPGDLYMGVNFSPTFGDPLEGTQIVGPEFTQSGITSFLAAGYALPSSVWHLDTEPASVAVAAHIVTPAPLFLDRGKTRLNLGGA